MAQQPAPLSAQASNPKTLGWMQGFPPSASKTIRFTDPDYFAFPKLRWTVCHFRELMPSAGVDKGTANVRPLPVALDTSLDNVTFTPLGSTKTEKALGVAALSLILWVSLGLIIKRSTNFAFKSISLGGPAQPIPA